MNDVDIKLIGDEELLKAFRELDYKTQHRRLKQVVSNAANIYVKAARKGIPTRQTKPLPTGKKWHPPGTGRKSMMKKMGKSRRNATVFVGPRTNTGNPQTDAWYLKFWEYGTKHLPPSLRIQSAYLANKKRVEDSMYNSMRVIITRVWNKHKK